MFVIEHVDELVRLTARHLQLCGLAVALACCISIPLGIAATRFRWMKGPVLTIAGIMFTIPSLALFAVLIPLTGLGVTTAVTVLVLYSVLAILRNTIAAIDSLSPTTLDAACGMGMSNFQRLFMVEFPLGLPVIVTGIRAALVSTIGIATVAAYIGAGGLGELIFTGIRRDDMPRLVVGATLTAALAIAADVGLTCVEKALRRGTSPSSLHEQGSN